MRPSSFERLIVLAVSGGLAAMAVACSSAGPPEGQVGPDGSAGATSAPEDGAVDAGRADNAPSPADGPLLDGAAGADGGTVDGARHALGIQWDYRFDSQKFLQDPVRRGVLEEAARIWGRHLHNDFEAIPQGTNILVRNPETYMTAGVVMPVEYPIDDIVIFVASADRDGVGLTLAGARASAAIGSVMDSVLGAKLGVRFNGPQFEPWTGWMNFDRAEPWFFDATPTTDDDVPAQQIDLLTVALHEIGHVLGVGGSMAFTALVDANGNFKGPAAMAEHGGPVPLAPDLSHIQKGILSDGRAPVMDPSDRAGARGLPTPLDLAILVDLGYDVSP